jgi:hypothetical protein
VAEIRCNECDFVVRAVPAAELHKTLDAMELEWLSQPGNARTAQADYRHCVVDKKNKSF